MHRRRSLRISAPFPGTRRSCQPAPWLPPIAVLDRRFPCELRQDRAPLALLLPPLIETSPANDLPIVRDERDAGKHQLVELRGLEMVDFADMLRRMRELEADALAMSAGGKAPALDHGDL